MLLYHDFDPYRVRKSIKSIFLEIQKKKLRWYFLNGNPTSDLGNSGPVESIGCSGGEKEDKPGAKLTKLFWIKKMQKKTFYSLHNTTNVSFKSKMFSGFSFLLVLPVRPLLVQVLREVIDPVAHLPSYQVIKAKERS